MAVAQFVFGADEIEKALVNVAASVDNQSVWDLMLRAAKIITEEAARLAPDWHFFWDGQSRGIKEAIRALPGNIEKAASRDPYALACVSHHYNPLVIWTEYGTYLSRTRKLSKKSRPHGADMTHRGMPAHPFFRPAADGKSDEVISTISSGLKDIIESAGAK